MNNIIGKLMDGLYNQLWRHLQSDMNGRLSCQVWDDLHPPLHRHLSIQFDVLFNDPLERQLRSKIRL